MTKIQTLREGVSYGLLSGMIAPAYRFVQMNKGRLSFALVIIACAAYWWRSRLSPISPRQVTQDTSDLLDRNRVLSDKDLLPLILRNLDYSDLVQASKVCKRWDQVINDTPCLTAELLFGATKTVLRKESQRSYLEAFRLFIQGASLSSHSTRFLGETITAIEVVILHPNRFEERVKQVPKNELLEFFRKVMMCCPDPKYIQMALDRIKPINEWPTQQDVVRGVLLEAQSSVHFIQDEASANLISSIDRRFKVFIEFGNQEDSYFEKAATLIQQSNFSRKDKALYKLSLPSNRQSEPTLCQKKVSQETEFTHISGWQKRAGACQSPVGRLIVLFNALVVASSRAAALNKIETGRFKYMRIDSLQDHKDIYLDYYYETVTIPRDNFSG